MRDLRDLATTDSKTTVFKPLPQNFLARSCEILRDLARSCDIFLDLEVSVHENNHVL